MYRRIGKRILDVILASIGMVVASPIFLVIWAVVRWTIGKPGFFTQERPGFKGRPFVIVKFRTMTNERDKNGLLLRDEGRLTAVGRFLRSASLDELPELINVVRGDMSIVGPRPLLMRYLDRYSAEQMRRHDVRPGITGWAQVNGRNGLSWDEKFRLDVWYVDNLSLLLDLRIMLVTFWKIVKHEGINQEGYFSAPEFTGSKDT